MSTTLRMGELFCGPGGMSFGASLAAGDVLGSDTLIHAWANDIDQDTCNTYAKNLKPENIFCEDIRNFDFAKLSPVDILAFGFPCNDFSIVGEKLGLTGTFGPLYQYCVRAVNHVNPIAFVAENVGGLSSANDGSALERILDAFANAGDGYELVPHLYKAEEYGVPQARHRILIVGIRSDQSVKFRVPAPTHLGRFVSAREALEVPPILNSAKNNEFTRMAKQVIERLNHIKPGQNAFNADLPDHLQLNVRGAKISQIYKRLDPNKPSYTVTGSGGGGTHVYHYSEPRALTNRERARLQTFPDDFVFCGSKESVRKQIGMAVPPGLARVVFEGLFRSLLNQKYEYVSNNIDIKVSSQLSFVMEKKLAYR